MFQPASLKGDSPTPIDERLINRFLPIYFFIIVYSLIPFILFEYYYILLFWREDLYLYFFLFFPFNIFLAVFIVQLSALIISKLFLIIINLIHLPKEGQFRRDVKDRDYFFWNLRNSVKKWPLFISASHPFPWIKNRFTLRFFGVKIGKRSICDNSWISSEFVNIGKNVIIGMGATILSFGIEQDKFILKKIKIEDDVLIGAKCVIMPGTVIKRGVRLSAHSYTPYNSILIENGIYIGHPAKLIEE